MLVLLRFSRHRITKTLAIIYPILTLTAIVATANHYIIDAVGGLVILGAGYLVASWVERFRQPRTAPTPLEPTDSAVVEDDVDVIAG